MPPLLELLPPELLLLELLPLELLELPLELLPPELLLELLLPLSFPPPPPPPQAANMAVRRSIGNLPVRLASPWLILLLVVIIAIPF